MVWCRDRASATTLRGCCGRRLGSGSQVCWLLCWIAALLLVLSTTERRKSPRRALVVEGFTLLRSPPASRIVRTRATAIEIGSATEGAAPSSAAILEDADSKPLSQSPFFFASVGTDKMPSNNPTGSISSSTTAEAAEVTQQKQSRRQRRELGSQELFMLPRQYGPQLERGVVFPQLSHVSVHVLSATPSIQHLRVALGRLINAHPLLRARVEGSGEPDKRIDLFQMVRSGDPSPPTFVVDDEDDDDVDVFEDESGKRWLVDSVLRVVSLRKESELEASWQAAMRRDLDDSSWCQVRQEQGGPLWKLELHRVVETEQDEAPCALVLTFNHAISDQSSANRMVDQLLSMIAELDATGKIQETLPVSQDLPVSVEESVLGPGRRWKDAQLGGGASINTLRYVASKAAEGLRNPVILPDGSGRDEENSGSINPLSALTIISGRAAGGQDLASGARLSLAEFRSLDAGTTAALVQRCKEKGVSVSNAVTAAVALTATDFVGGGSANSSGRQKKERNYKILQSLDMRRFGARLDRGDTVACMAGSHDLIHGPLLDGSGATIRRDPSNWSELFWEIAREGKSQTEAFVKSKGPDEALRVFDFAVSISDLGNLVYLTSQSKDTRGRAYSGGATNVGVYESTPTFAGGPGGGVRSNLQTQHGRYRVRDVYFATPHTQSGCLYPVSLLTINGSLKMTFHPVSPIVSDETNRQFADAFVGLLEAVATAKCTADSDTIVSAKPLVPGLLSKLPLVTMVLGAASILSHGSAWVAFFRSVAEMKANVDNPADFWAALDFWIFFAVGHPLLQPILWISDVLHGTPGPKIADLVPALFLAANAVAIGVVAASKEIRTSLNIALLAAFFTYVGAGLDGTAGLGDFNLALDDSYKGQVVKGCPTYDAVRQSSMEGFDLNKYQGLWYEHKFHDWTQFKEVYDTTLNIKLTDNGLGWVDDFAVKGPAPNAAKLSWEKSPVANGAHYFLFGRVEKNDPPGILRESGFGVEFPNYIVDIQKDPESGEYTEAIQFQCLERGGVRVFEGINFMSRKPVMTAEELTNMHARAEKAGMYPYGASPEQMHTVARKLDNTPIDNSWQAMWRAIGFDTLLELLTESIEDGGR